MQKQHWYVIIVFAIAKFLVPFLCINAAFQLHRDEYLYLADGVHLAWGYIEMPPLLAFLGSISLWLGGSFYAVYFWGALFGALTMVIIGKTVIKLNGNLYAVLLACLAFLCSGFLRLHALFQPNFLDVFFWSLSMYCTICLIKYENKKYLYLIGCCFGLGMLSKYTMAFFILSFLVAVLFTPLRKWFLTKHFYLAMLLAFVIWLPNLLWQYNHHFPVVHHMKLLKENLLDNISRTDFLVDQILITVTGFYIWMIGLWYLLVNKIGRKFTAIAIIYVSIILLLLYFKGKGYYACGLYPVLIGIGAVQVSNGIQKYRIKLLYWILPIIIVLIIWQVFPVIMPYATPEKLIAKYQKIHADKIGVLKWEDGENHSLPQDFADMLGWEEMAAKASTIYYQLPDSIRKNTLIFGDNYGEAGALNFYRKRFNLPETYSDDASFVFWLPKNFDKKNLLLIDFHPRRTDDYVFGHFKKVQTLDSVTNTYAREHGVKMILYSQPDDSLGIVSGRAIETLKAAYNIH